MKTDIRLNFNGTNIEIIETGKFEGVLNERESGYQTVDFWISQITQIDIDTVTTPIIQFERFVPDKMDWQRVQSPTNYVDSNLITDKGLYCTDTIFPTFPSFLVTKEMALNEDGTYKTGYTNFYDWWNKSPVGQAIKGAVKVGIHAHNK